MNNNHQNGHGIYGKGYYIALMLCAAAIGVSAFVYYRSAGAREVLAPTEPAEQVPAAVTEDFPAAVTQPATEPTKAPARKEALKTAAPVSGQTVAEYAMDCLSYNQTTRDWRVHNGMDIAAPEGTQVMAAAEGQVYTVFEDDIMGWTVVIRHEGGYTTTYSSLAEELSVSAGDTVELGQTIGRVGTTALIETAMGPHVHFSVRFNDEPMDPAEFLSLSN